MHANCSPRLPTGATESCGGADRRNGGGGAGKAQQTRYFGHHRSSRSARRHADDCRCLRGQCPYKAIAVFLPSGLEFYIEAEAGLPPRPPALSKSGSGPGCASHANSPPKYLDPDPGGTSPPLAQILDSGFTLCLASPLVSGSGQARGAITVFDLQPGILDDAAREIIQSLCDLARLAIEHGRLYEEVVHRSQYDRLTGLPNRLLLEDRLRQAMIVARRQGTLLAVCCIDLDRFKSINDSLGHELGDVFFKLVSERLNLSIREIDTLARHSGDEFILALRDVAETSDATKFATGCLRT